MEMWEQYNIDSTLNYPISLNHPTTVNKIWQRNTNMCVFKEMVKIKRMAHYPLVL
jgi:hypothetical protein